jgi:hypothetical protein
LTEGRAAVLTGGASGGLAAAKRFASPTSSPNF